MPDRRWVPVNIPGYDARQDNRWRHTFGDSRPMRLRKPHAERVSPDLTWNRTCDYCGSSLRDGAMKRPSMSLPLLCLDVEACLLRGACL